VLTLTDLDRSVREFLAAVAAPTPSATGGAVCAVTAAAAAGLAAMTAGVSEMDGAETRKANALREQAMALVEADAVAYQAVLDAQRRPSDDPGRAAALRDALVGAAEPPLRIAQVSADIAALAAHLVQHGKRVLRGDAISAVTLAAAAARSAAVLVHINRSSASRLDPATPLPPDRASADEAAAAAQRSADVALATDSGL
jgi:formiminotetrahydrofolate cyclodeaminase